MWLPPCSQLIYISQSVAAWGSHIMLQIVTFWAELIYFRHICEKSPLKKALAVADTEKEHNDSQGVFFNRQLPRMGIAMLDKTVN